MPKLAGLAVIILTLGLPFGAAHGAELSDLTACRLVPAAEAEKFVGGPLDVTKIDKKIMLNAPWSHESTCTYGSKGFNADDPAGAQNFLDLALRFFPSSEAAQAIHQGMIEQFRKIAGAPDMPFEFATLAPLDGFDGRAFLLEVIADKTASYKSAQVLFFKGTVGGSISAWKKPASSLETTKSVLNHIFATLP